MGIINSKDFATKRKIDEATSNSSLSNLRYITIEKSKWKMFRKKDQIPVYPARTYKAVKGCPCGNDGPCKQKVTPKGVTIHYPKKKKRKFGKFSSGRQRTPPKPEKGYYNTIARPIPKVKIVRQRTFPTWRMDAVTCESPFYSPVVIRP